jgi:hypothetical protein
LKSISKRGGNEKFTQNVKGTNHLGELVTDGKITGKCILNKYGIVLWTQFNCHNMGASGRMLWIQR